MKTLISIDPSSTAAGYAVWDIEKQKLLTSGVVKPPERWVVNRRIKFMAESLRDSGLIHKVRTVVIEDTSGKVGYAGGKRGMNGAGLSVYGKALGYIWREMETLNPIAGDDGEPAIIPVEVILIKENDWTRNKKKGTRTAMIALEFRTQYDPAKDKGGDQADAIGLGRFWLTLNRINGGV